MITNKTIAICDLDAAVAAVALGEKTKTRVCILAQFGMRVLNVPEVNSTYSDVWIGDVVGSPKLSVRSNIVSLVQLFDDHQYGEVRRRLPLDVEVAIN